MNKKKREQKVEGRVCVCVKERDRERKNECVTACVCCTCMLCVWCTCIVGHIVYAVSDVSQSFGAVINAIESCHVRCGVIR